MPGTFRPLANKDNDYLMDRAAQKAGKTYSGVEGFAMQDASLQESMGPIVDRTKENLVSTDNGIIMARQRLMRAAKALVEKGVTPPGVEPAHQRVRSASVVLPPDQPFKDAAREALGRACRRRARLGLRQSMMLSESARMSTARGSALPHRRPQLEAARRQGDRARRPERARWSSGSRRRRGTGRPSSPPRPSTARPRTAKRFSMQGWLSDLAGRTKDLIDEIATADLVVMIATAGENAHAAALIGEACSRHAG